MEHVDVVVAAARHQVGLLPREDLPMLAAEWLVAGLDTPLLRELAGLHRDDLSVTGLWPGVLAEWGVEVPIADPRRVLAPWAARQVLDGERDVAWLVRSLLRGIPVDDHDDELVSLLYDLDSCLEVLEQPTAAKVRDIADVVAGARAEVGRIVLHLARLDVLEDPPPPPPPLPRDQALVEAAVRAVRDDLRRVTRRRWTLDEDRPGSWTLRSPSRATALDLDPLVDPDALPPETDPEHVDQQIDQQMVDEATAHVGDAVQEALDACGARFRCRLHAASLMICSGLWVCDSRAVHEIGEVGSLRRRDVELHITE